MAFGALLSGTAALLGCSSGSGTETGLRTSADQHDSALPTGGDVVQPSSTDVSDTDVSGSESPAARDDNALDDNALDDNAHDDNALDVCPAYAEFEPLGPIPDQYGAYWKFLDPHADYVYWTHEWLGNDVRIDHYRWTAAGGIERLDPLLQLPAVAGETHTYVNYVSLDGRVLLGTRTSEGGSELFRYAPETGAVELDVYPRALSRDGKVALELRDGRPLRRTETGETTELALPSEMLTWDFGPALFWSSETVDTLLGAGVRAGAEAHVVRWTAASGWVDLGLLPAGVLQPETSAMTVSDAGNAIVGTLGNPADGGSRVFRWTEASGSTDLGVLAGLPPEASYRMTHLSADGSVVVGSVQIPGLPASHVFRWTQALGMQNLLPGARAVEPSHMSAQGDVVVVRYTGTSVQTNGQRWTPAGGVENLELYVRAASADGNLLVGARGAEPAIEAFGASGADSSSLAALASPTIVPADWSQAFIEQVSADGQLIVGTATNPQGEREGWLLRRTERCPGR